MHVCGPLAGSGNSNDDAFLNLGRDYPDNGRFQIVLWDIGGVEPIPHGTTSCTMGEITLCEGVAQVEIYEEAPVGAPIHPALDRPLTGPWRCRFQGSIWLGCRHPGGSVLGETPTAPPPRNRTARPTLAGVAFGPSVRKSRSHAFQWSLGKFLAVPHRNVARRGTEWTPNEALPEAQSRAELGGIGSKRKAQ